MDGDLLSDNYQCSGGGSFCDSMLLLEPVIWHFILHAVEICGF